MPIPIMLNRTVLAFPKWPVVEQQNIFSPVSKTGHAEYATIIRKM